MNTYERAIQIYQVLIGAAQNRQLLTYDIVGKYIGVPRHGLANHLLHLLRYCEEHHLPRLTSICVSEVTGQPSHGYTGRIEGSLEELHRDREQVYAHKWYAERPISVEDLKALDPKSQEAGE